MRPKSCRKAEKPGSTQNTEHRTHNHIGGAISIAPSSCRAASLPACSLAGPSTDPTVEACRSGPQRRNTRTAGDRQARHHCPRSFAGQAQTVQISDWPRSGLARAQTPSGPKLACPCIMVNVRLLVVAMLPTRRSSTRSSARWWHAQLCRASFDLVRCRSRPSLGSSDIAGSESAMDTDGTRPGQCKVDRSPQCDEKRGSRQALIGAVASSGRGWLPRPSSRTQQCRVPLCRCSTAHFTTGTTTTSSPSPNAHTWASPRPSTNLRSSSVPPFRSRFAAECEPTKGSTGSSRRTGSESMALRQHWCRQGSPIAC